MLKPEVYKQKRQELEKKFVELQQTYVKLERELAGERAKLIQDLLKQAEPEDRGDREGRGRRRDPRPRGRRVGRPGVDLTAKLNAEMK